MQGMHMQPITVRGPIEIGKEYAYRLHQQRRWIKLRVLDLGLGRAVCRTPSEKVIEVEAAQLRPLSEMESR